MGRSFIALLARARVPSPNPSITTETNRVARIFQSLFANSAFGLPLALTFDDHREKGGGVNSGVTKPFSHASGFRLDLDVDFARRARKIFQERRTKPAFHFKLVAVIPIAAGFFAAPLQFEIGAGKRPSTENGTKTFISIGNASNDLIDHRINSGNEWFFRQTDCGIIEDPHPFVFVRRDDEERIYGCVLNR